METFLETSSSENTTEVISAIYKISVEKILSEIEEKAKQYPETAEIEIEDNILELSDLLGEVVERALDLVDNTPIKLIRSPRGRELFEVNGNYILFPNLPYCCCQSFQKQVVVGEEYCCKHYIATRIARALNKVEVVGASLVDFRKFTKRICF